MGNGYNPKVKVSGSQLPTSFLIYSAFSMSGLLIQKLNSIWFCELRNEEAKFHQLPIEGGFQSLDFEPTSRHALISTRNLQNSPRHIVCELTQYYSDAQEASVCSCNIVQSFQVSSSALVCSCILRLIEKEKYTTYI